MQDNLEKILIEMNNILDSLIENATHLLELSIKVIEEEELEPLQKHQDQLMSLLVEKDEKFNHVNSQLKENYQSPLRIEIDKKLDVFKQLNDKFIENIINTHGLIQFNKNKIKKKIKSKNGN